MFGSDNRPYGRIIERMEAVPFLTAAQKRAIYYDNAARFLRLSPEDGARHRSRR
jgi:predicted TIM-barrel fold metal-dependent hydrolase